MIIDITNTVNIIPNFLPFSEYILVSYHNFAEIYLWQWYSHYQVKESLVHIMKRSHYLVNSVYADGNKDTAEVISIVVKYFTIIIGE